MECNQCGLKDGEIAELKQAWHDQAQNLIAVEQRLNEAKVLLNRVLNDELIGEDDASGFGDEIVTFLNT
ncbi:hypothetical protein SAMN05428988_1332 [Chitinophaga sp. YR573]|uniref:hypothetical protein n=1 Tax=Chitinophaga sp. YR573 TaxID=1881040 RepID=UPI0008C89410|nr:hypothetical protein [Chitinophaga sp. YR573]SEW02137.1 hypothetical protein SAMN05428988_1332 [Chitinophaga sp. YR573]